MILSSIERKIVGISENDIVREYIRTHKDVKGAIYTCSTLAVFGTNYSKKQVVILPESDNNLMAFGLIEELLSCDKHAYLLYNKLISVYCPKSDLYFVNESEDFDFIPIHQLGCFRPLETYELGKNNRVAVSLRSFVFA